MTKSPIHTPPVPFSQILFWTSMGTGTFSEIVMRIPVTLQKMCLSPFSMTALPGKNEFFPYFRSQNILKIFWEKCLTPDIESGRIAFCVFTADSLFLQSHG
jgi:hypothetical protein